VSIDGNTSILFDLLPSKIQGSVLGPVFYTIFVSLLFNIIPLLLFADNSYTVELNACKINLVKDMEKSLEAISKWLRKSGLKVNDDKTDLCLIYNRYTTPISVGNTIIKSRSESFRSTV
jgi:hypothetical protein